MKNSTRPKPGEIFRKHAMRAKSRSIASKTFLALAVLAACPAIKVRAADIFWNGGTATYNNPSNWVGGVIPAAGDNAFNDTGTNNVVQILSPAPDWNVHDIRAGNGAGTSGAYVQNGPSVILNGNAWFRLGIGAGSLGVYDLNGGTLSVQGGRIRVAELGTGVFNINGGTITKSGDVFALADGPVESTGTVNQTGGTINSTSELWVGQAQGTGFYNFSGGTINLGNWLAVGRAGGNGTFTMTGGNFNKNSGGNFIVSDNGTALFQQSGGTITCVTEMWVGQAGSGNGQYDLSANGVINVSNWFAVGREGGTGVMNISGGAITKTGNGNIVLGALSGNGTVNQSGGAVTNTASQTWIGEGGTGVWNMNGGTNMFGTVHIAENASSTGTLNMNGGVMNVLQLSSGNIGGFSTLNLNGGTIRATANNVNFLNNLSLAQVQAGGAVFDSAGFNITVAQSMFDSGGGGLTKNGAGTLTLTGANNYSGPTLVNAGKLVVSADSTGGGSLTVVSGAELTVKLKSANAQLLSSGVTFNSPTAAVGFDLDGFGNPSVAPLSVSGTLNVNGTVSVNIADTLPQVGQFPLIQYASRTGSGSFVMGSLPPGVQAHLVTNAPNSSIDLVITSAGIPRWDGTVAGGVWDINTTPNWIDIGTGTPTTYREGNPVIFDDNAIGTTTVNLTATVNPGSVTLANNSLPYTLTGSGKISGSVSVVKSGSGTFAIANTGGNNYTGPTVINGGVLSVASLANGGSPSAIGASSANPTNLVLANGALSYTGPAATINRGYTVGDTNATIDVQTSLTLSGQVAADLGSGFVKTGPGKLTYTGTGVNNLSGGASMGYRVAGGTVLFDGSNGGQTNINLGNFQIDTTDVAGAALILSNATLNVQSGRFDLGEAGASGSLTIYPGSVLNKQGNVFALGDSGGFGLVNHIGGTIESSSEMWVGQFAGGSGVYNLSGGNINLHNWLAVGRAGGVGTFNMTGGTINKDGNGNIVIAAEVGGPSVGTFNHSAGTITTVREYWIAEGGSATGTNNISGSAVLNINNWVAIGRGGNAVLNMSGGAITKAGNGSFIIGAGGSGLINQTGGTFTNIATETWVAENGTALWDISGGSATLGMVHIAQNGGGVGTVNLNGGVLRATEITTGNTGASSTLNFNGGTLVARGNNANFLHNLSAANVLAGGAKIDSDVNVVTIAQALLDGGGNGGLTKTGTGTLYLNGANTYTGSTLVNAGTLGGTGTIAGPVSVASGAKLAPGASIGTLTINNSLSLAAGSTTSIEVSFDGGTTNNDQVVGLTGINYAGSLVVTNVGSNSLPSGSMVFKLFNSAAPGSGNFSQVTVLPSGNGSFNPATGELTITTVAAPTVNPPAYVGGNLILTGTGGTPGGSYTWLTSTNVAAPAATWTTNTTGTFNGSGAFSNAIPVNTSEAARFFLLRVP